MMPFPISDTSPVEHTSALPEAADCVVIGGGVIGVMTAYWLARAGQSVVLVEKGRVAGEQSSRNWGWIRCQGRDAAELPIAIEALQHWRELAPQLDTDIGLTQGGVLYLAKDAKQLASYERWTALAARHDLDTRVLGRPEVKTLLPGAVGDWPGAMYTASDMRAEPWVAVPALARLAVRTGVVIRENCAARTVEMTAGRVSGVVTEDGVVRCSSVVVAGGAWSRLLLQSLGVQIPQLSVRASVVATEPLPEVSQIAAADHRLAFRRRADGGYTLAAEGFHELLLGRDAFRSFPKYIQQLRDDPFGTRFVPAAPTGYPDAWGTPRRWAADKPSPFEAIRVLNPRPHMGRMTRVVRDFSATYPAFGEVGIKTAWAGMIDTMPDLVPVVDHAESMPGLVIATGMSGHGFGIGPGFGRVVADLVMGNDTGHDLTRFRLGRFSDGSPIVIDGGF